MSIQKEPDPRDLRYLKLVTGRLQSRDENDIAADARCESPAALYQQLAQDGFPVCRVCGATHVEEGHCEKSERRARQGEGPRQELPPPAQAISLFEQALRVLKEEIDALKNRKMYLQDERFVAVEEHRDPIVWSRLGISDEDWKAICQRFGKDPTSDRFELWDARFVEPAGAAQSPQEPLTKLIAIYVLADLPLEPLLERLHFAPGTVAKAELKRHIEGEKVKSFRQ